MSVSFVAGQLPPVFFICLIISSLWLRSFLHCIYVLCVCVHVTCFMLHITHAHGTGRQRERSDEYQELIGQIK